MGEEGKALLLRVRVVVRPREEITRRWRSCGDIPKEEHEDSERRGGVGTALVQQTAQLASQLARLERLP